ncbi:HIT family hydrolase [Candidatus Marsarchaeota G2 archaeon ECH_B_SAG-G16]|uniref:HIT family hydrolase n=3 Tax=Candidatus Marsarchaeota TaxID=1978152 RepID=A0A2R6AE33_9ARCH|nr:MAG: HIT family hydrolase [Candidatus Marsarchaeota G1 archaeon OSP_D]PSN89731.1 MAG: HIT family hydrolase [Candidatus Marsarchaeota G1 archaeon OSP_C]PSO04289.1 MAG: HIT family hydrolase [Candidatus Marsarchaeota G2 archaeon ECH_B_SAG-G16]
MQRLWAPWRIEYLEKFKEKKEEGCFICDAVAATDQKKHYVLEKGVHHIVLMNLYPYNSGHLLVAPIDHVAQLENLDEKVVLAIFGALVKWLSVIKKAMKPDGFNLGINLGEAAGAGLPQHLHIHIVPRWVGDTNFMPTIGSTKVISESLDATYQKLLNALSQSS